MNYRNFGLKLWSINNNYISEAIRLYKEGYYQYIELYAVERSYSKYINLWVHLRDKNNIPFIIHAPHSLGGMKLSRSEFLKTNLILANETKRFADTLEANIIIFHPGVGGNREVTVFQLNKINDKRILIENKPYYAIGKKEICVGYSPEDIEFIMQNANVGFCLDIVHAVCAANAFNEPYMDYLKRFLALGPSMFHLVDCELNSLEDNHLNPGKGSIDIPAIIKLIPADKRITIETDKSSNNSLKDFEADVLYLRSI